MSLLTSAATCFIENFPKHQSVRRRGHAGDAAILFYQHLLHGSRRKFSEARLDDRSHDAAAHFVKEAIAFNDERDRWAIALHVAACDCANGGSFFVTGIR